MKKILGAIAIPAVVSLGYFIMYDFFILGYGSAAIRARQKLCFINQREIQDAVSFFDLDAKSPNDEMKGLDLGRLVKGKYLKVLPVCPFQGDYLLSKASEGKTTFCTFHGSEDQKIPGKLDPGYGLLYWIKDWVVTNSK